jgi:hypothetical protein
MLPTENPIDLFFFYVEYSLDGYRPLGKLELAS